MLTLTQAVWWCRERAASWSLTLWRGIARLLTVTRADRRRSQYCEGELTVTLAPCWLTAASVSPMSLTPWCSELSLRSAVSWLWCQLCINTRKTRGTVLFLPTSITLSEEQASPWQRELDEQVWANIIMEEKKIRGMKNVIWSFTCQLVNHTFKSTGCCTSPVHLSACLSGLLSSSLRRYVFVMFVNYLFHFALSILYETRRRNYALVASVWSQAGERGGG